MNSTNQHNESKAILYALIAIICWSTVATAFKVALDYQSVSSLIFIASSTTVILLGSILAVQGRLSDTLADLSNHWKTALIFGALNPLLYYHVLLWAYDLLPAQVAQPINYTWAIVLAFMAVPFLGHRLSKYDLLALFICYAGVVVISQGASSDSGESNLLGVGLALLSTVIWASYWILNSRDQREPIAALFQNFLVVIPFTMLLAWPITLSWQAIASSAYIGVFEMGISFVCWLFAMKRTRNASRISNLIFLAPFISLVLIHFILDEAIHHYTFYGLVLIIGGLFIQNRQKKT